MRSVEFKVAGRKFSLARDGNVRHVFDTNGVEWSDEELVTFGGETEATTALAYALRDLDVYTDYALPDER
jgi:hypothetical protein